MANIKSAIKRVEISERNQLRNKSYKSAIRTLTKKYLAAVEQYVAHPNDEARELVQHHMSATYSKIDKAVKKGILHPNNGANKKRKLARLFSQQVEQFVPSQPQ